MSIKIDDAKDGVGFIKTTFPAGESCIRLTERFEGDLCIDFDFESNSDLFDLALLVDAIRRAAGFKLGKLLLFMAYVPYARQDRVCNPGESLSIKVVADFINALKFDGVCVMDPHSDVSAALFDNLQVSPQSDAAGEVALRMDVANTLIVAPDAGASKKASQFAKVGGFPGMIQAEKVRDLQSGNILETRVPDMLVGSMDFLIVDDICDGGRTFIELAKKLRPLTTGKIMLYVTHGIFSAGPEVFDNLIDAVYTANPVGAKGEAAVASGKVIRI